MENDELNMEKPVVNKPVRSMDGESVENESNASKRLRLLGIENDDKIHDTEAEIKKGNFFANLWYKRKWLIIITTFFVLVFGGLIVFCATRDDPDIRIAYNGSADLGAKDLEKINSYFSELVPDYDGDGKIDIDWTKNRYLSNEEIKELNKGQEGNAYTENANNEALTQINHLVTFSDYNFMLVSEAVFDEFVEGFFKISELELEGDYTSITYRDRGIYLHKTEFAKSNPELLSIFPADTLICIPNRMSKNIDKETALFNAILTYQKEEE